LLEDRRNNARLWKGVELNPGNFKVVVVDSNEELLKIAEQGIYFADHFKTLGLLRRLTRKTRKLLGRYFDLREDGTYQLKDTLRQFIEIRPFDLEEFAPEQDEKFDLTHHNYSEYLTEESQVGDAPIKTFIIASRMLKWFKEGGLLLTTAGKWIRFFREMSRIARGKGIFLEKGIRSIDIFLYQYGRIDYTSEWFDEEYARLKQRILRIKPEFNIALFDFAYERAKEVHFPVLREHGEPYLVHPLGLCFGLLENKKLVNNFIRSPCPWKYMLSARLCTILEKKLTISVSRRKVCLGCVYSFF